jgi:hypothetical protein
MFKDLPDFVTTNTQTLRPKFRLIVTMNAQILLPIMPRPIQHARWIDTCFPEHARSRLWWLKHALSFGFVFFAVGLLCAHRSYTI